MHVHVKCTVGAVSTLTEKRAIARGLHFYGAPQKRSKHGPRNVAYVHIHTYLGHLADGHIFQGRIQRHVCFLFLVTCSSERLALASETLDLLAEVLTPGDILRPRE